MVTGGDVTDGRACWPDDGDGAGGTGTGNIILADLPHIALGDNRLHRLGRLLPGRLGYGSLALVGAAGKRETENTTEQKSAAEQH